MDLFASASKSNTLSKLKLLKISSWKATSWNVLRALSFNVSAFKTARSLQLSGIISNEDIAALSSVIAAPGFARIQELIIEGGMGGCSMWVCLM